MIRKLLITCCLLLTLPSFALNLKEKFSDAEPGSYIVTQQNKCYTLLHIHTQTEEELILEEITVPTHAIDKTNLNWQNWIQAKAPGHTSWIMYSIDLSENMVTECYSYNRRAWLPTASMNSFLMTLLQLDLHLISQEDRLAMGASSRPGEVGIKKVWTPIQYVDGKKVQHPEFNAYKARWPLDDSELAGKEILLYFDNTQEGFPFPYWMQARESALRFKIRSIDSGYKLNSPYTHLPRRAPHFVGSPKKDNDTLTLTLESPPYYRNFKLYAVDTTSSPRITHPMTFKMERKDSHVIFHIEELALKKGHDYTWIAVPEGSNHFAETQHAIPYP